MLLEITRQNYLQEFQTFLAEYKSNIYDLNLICGIDEISDISIKSIEFQQNIEICLVHPWLLFFLLCGITTKTRPQGLLKTKVSQCAKSKTRHLDMHS